MTAYRFRRIDTDEVITISMSFDELMSRVLQGRITLDDGAIAIRVDDPIATSPPQKRDTVGRHGEIRSRNFGVGVDQIDEARAKAKQLGCHGVEFCPKTGDAIFSSNKARTKALLRHGMRDKDSYTH